LRDAVKGSEAPHEIVTIQTHNAPGGKEPFERAYSYRIRHRVVRGHEDDAVGDVEVDVASGHTLTFVIDGGRHWKSDNFERAPGFVVHRLQSSQIVFQPSVVFVRRVLFTAVTTVDGLAKRARSSTCPSVSSPAIPSPSQRIFVAPRYSRRYSSISFLLK